MLLGIVADIFAQHPIIPSKVLQGELRAKSSPFSYLTIKRSDRQDTLQLWQSLGAKARTSLSYNVTIGVRTPTKPTVTHRSRGSGQARNILAQEKSGKLERS